MNNQSARPAVEANSNEQKRPQLQPARLVRKRRKKNKKCTFIFRLDPNYCQKCPNRLYQGLNEGTAALRIQIENAIKLIIIEYAATIEYDKSKAECKHCYLDTYKNCPFCRKRSLPTTWRTPCVRCHKAGCPNCYARRHANCQKLMAKHSYAGLNTQQHKNNKTDRYLGGAGHIPGRYHAARKWALQWGAREERKFKHNNWRTRQV